jgi:hypothetical protein
MQSPLTSGFEREHDAMSGELSSKFGMDGYLVVEDIFPKALVDEVYNAAEQNFNEVLSCIECNRLSFGVGIKMGFKEIVQRHPNRYEMPYKMDDARFDFVLRSTALRDLVAGILECDDFIVANRSLVVSKPGCTDQAWHSDGPHMSATQHLPCHVLNVFVPLVDITSSNGPTEFRPGSHFYTRGDLAKSMFIAKMKKQLRPLHAPEIKRGSVLLVRLFSVVGVLLSSLWPCSLITECYTEVSPTCRIRCGPYSCSPSPSRGTR